jgi:hypothetical protein
MKTNAGLLQAVQRDAEVLNNVAPFVGGMRRVERIARESGCNGRPVEAVMDRYLHVVVVKEKGEDMESTHNIVDHASAFTAGSNLRNSIGPRSRALVLLCLVYELLICTPSFKTWTMAITIAATTTSRRTSLPRLSSANGIL